MTAKRPNIRKPLVDILREKRESDRRVMADMVDELEQGLLENIVAELKTEAA